MVKVKKKKTGAAEVKLYSGQKKKKKKETYFHIKIPLARKFARKFPFPRVNNISPARTRLLNTDYKIV